MLKNSYCYKITFIMQKKEKIAITSRNKFSLVVYCLGQLKEPLIAFL